MERSHHLKAAQDFEAHVRRLGMALVRKWNAIPPFAQDQLLDQACEDQPTHATREMRRSLKLFLEKKR